MFTLGGFVAAKVIDLGVRFAAGAYEAELLGRRFRRPRLELSLSGLWAIKLLLVLVAAGGMGLLQTALAAGPFAMTVSEAGLGTAILALGAYLVAPVVLGGVVAAMADRIRSGRTRSSGAPAVLEPEMVRVGTISAKWAE